MIWRAHASRFGVGFLLGLVCASACGTRAGLKDVDGATPPRNDAGSRTDEGQAVEALRQAGYRRGTLICECALPGQAAEQREGCIRAESATAKVVMEPAGERCALALARDSSLLRSYLECEAKKLDAITACLRQGCGPLFIPPICNVDDTCPNLPSDLEKAWTSCNVAFYCGDVRMDDSRCNHVVDCADGSDEEGCPPF